MAVVKNLMVRAGADFSALRKETERARKTLKTFKKTTAKTMTSIKRTLIALGIGKIIKDSISSAMKTIESENLFDTVMGKWSKSVRAWSMELQKSLGLNAYEIRKNVGVLFNMTRSMGLAEDSALQMSKQLTELAYDMASFYNISNDEAFNKIRAGLTGETEPLKRLGILVNENTIKQVAYKNGIASVGSELTEQQKVMARHLAIMEQTGTAQGDLARTIDSPANQLRILTTQLKVIQINLGMAFMPIAQIVLPMLRSLATQLAIVTSYFSTFTHVLFGIENQQNNISKGANNAANEIEQMGDNIQAAGKKAKGALAGFDEINSLAQSSSGAGITSSISGVTGSNIAEASLEFKTNVDETKNKIEKAAQVMKNSITKLKDTIKKHSDEIIAAFAGMTAAIAAFKLAANFGAIVTGIKLAFEGLAAAIAAISVPALIVGAIIGSIVATITYLWKTNDGFRNAVIKAWEKIKEVTIKVLEVTKKALINLWETKLVPFGKWLGTIFAKAWEKVGDAAKWLGENVLKPLGDFLLWIKDNVLKPLGDILVDVLAVAFGIVKDVAEILWKNVLVPLGSFIKGNFKPLIEALTAVFTFLWKNTLTPLATFIANRLKVIFQDLVSVLEFLWQDVLKPLVEFLWGRFRDTLETVASVVEDVIYGMQTSFNGLLNFITGVFTGNWDRAWEGVKNIFKGIFDSLVGIAKTPLNFIIDMVNEVIRGINKMIDTLNEVPGVSLPTVPGIPRLAKGGITNGPMVAMIGDNPGGREVVSPLNDLMDMISSAVSNAMLATSQFSNNSNCDGDIVLNIDGSTFARIISPYIEAENNRLGSNMIITTV